MTVLVALAAIGVPAESWRAAPLDPCHVATIAAIVVTVALLLLRSRARASPAEIRILAMLLAAMPFVYIASWVWVTPRDPVSWLLLETAAAPVFVGLAVLGVRRSPWFLVGGIAGHGAGWDAWHHLHPSAVPDWYAKGCLLVDVGVALYAATCVPRWRVAMVESFAARP